MKYTETKCSYICDQEGKLGELVVDFEVCPFEHYCHCVCPELNKTRCQIKCVQDGEIPVAGAVNHFECEICQCECDKNINCWSKCIGKLILQHTAIALT